MHFHIQYLRNELMEQNFLKIVEPYDVVEIEYVARKMDLPKEEVGKWLLDNAKIVRKLSQMILDKKLLASLDQEKGLLIMLPESAKHEIAEDAIETIDLMTEVVDVLKTRADAYNAKLQDMYFVW